MMTAAGTAVPWAPATANSSQGVKETINSELWQACAGPLVNLPAVGTLVVYFPQGHLEQDMDAEIPFFSNFPSKLLCRLDNVTLHGDPKSDEVFAKMTLQPVDSFDKNALLISAFSIMENRPQCEIFCKALTVSDTCPNGDISIPYRVAMEIFPPLIFTDQPSTTLKFVARDLCNNVWAFEGIYHGQTFFLTNGWNNFVSQKKLFSGDSVLFIRDKGKQLHVGIRRSNSQDTNLLPLLTIEGMKLGILATVYHAASTSSPFPVLFYPRVSPSEFVIPLAKYYKAFCSNQICVGMRFCMMFEAEESGTRRYLGTIVGIGDQNPERWKNSQWRNLKVQWYPTAEAMPDRVSVWDIEPETDSLMFSGPPLFERMHSMMPDGDTYNLDSLLKTVPWNGDGFGMMQRPSFPGQSLGPQINMQHNPSMASSEQLNDLHSLPGSFGKYIAGRDLSCQLGLPAPVPQENNLGISSQRPTTSQHIDQLQSSPVASLESICQPRPEFSLSSSSSSSSKVCRFRNLLRKATYEIKSTTISRPSGDTSQEGEVHSDKKGNISAGDKNDIQLRLPLVPFSITTNEIIGSWSNLTSGGHMLCKNYQELELASGILSSLPESPQELDLASGILSRLPEREIECQIPQELELASGIFSPLPEWEIECQSPQELDLVSAFMSPLPEREIECQSPQELELAYGILSPLPEMEIECQSPQELELVSGILSPLPEREIECIPQELELGSRIFSSSSEREIECQSPGT